MQFFSPEPRQEMLKKKKILREFEVTKKAKMNDDLNTLRYMISYWKGIPVRKQYSHERGAYTASRTKWLTTKTNEEWVSTRQLSGRQAYTNKTVKWRVPYITSVVQYIMITCYD